jgi:hypothetical protein
VNAGNGGGNNNGGGNHGGNGKGKADFAAVSSVTAAGTATGQANTDAGSNLVLWSLVGAGALTASAAFAAVVRRRAKDPQARAQAPGK